MFMLNKISESESESFNLPYHVIDIFAMIIVS